MAEDVTALPNIVTADAWQRSIDALRIEEKRLTRELDALNAERRRLPMVRIDKEYEFVGVNGSQTLLGLFDGRRQLITYHFMFGPDWDAGCPGCSWVVDAMSHPAHLRARDVNLVLVSRAPLEELQDYRERMGWDLPWFSSLDSDFNVDMGVTTDQGEDHGVSVFIRDGDEIYRTYFTGDRGVEHLGSHWTYLDLTPYGRQETWEDSPAGWPQSETYSQQRRHDEYD